MSDVETTSDENLKGLLPIARKTCRWDWIGNDNSCGRIRNISMGKDLRITTASGQPIPIKTIWQDVVHDITVMEVDVAKMPSVPLPFAYCQSGAGIVVPLANGPFDDTDERFRIQKYSHMESMHTYRGVYIEGAQAFLGPNLGSAPMSVILAPWATPPKDFVWGEQKYESHTQPHNLDNESLQSYQPFPRGASGSPVVIPFDNGVWGSTYLIGGLLTMSQTDGESSSSYAGGKPIMELFALAGRGRTPKTEISPWYLLNGYFVRLNRNLEFFIYSGPVGNGVTLDGLVMQGDSSVDKGDFLHQLQTQLNLSPTQSFDVAQKLQSLSGPAIGDIMAGKIQKSGIPQELMQIH